MAQPFSDRTLLSGHCNLILDRTTRAVQGNWHVLLGLPGRVSELPVDRSVTVDCEFGHIIDNGTSIYRRLTPQNI